MTDFQNTQSVIKALVSGGDGSTGSPGPETRVTKAAAVALSQETGGTTEFRNTQSSVRALSSLLQTPVIRLTSSALRVLEANGPNLEWLDVFYEVRFPEDISYGSKGGPGFQTDVLQVKSGVDQRISRWSLPLYQYDVSWGVKTMEQLHALLGLFNVVGGKAGGFRYKDWLDYRSTTPLDQQARSQPEPTPSDQLLGDGDDLTVNFQLRKQYEYGSASMYRTIWKPVAGTVRVALDDVEVTNFTVDTTSGMITFIPRVTVTSNAIGCTLMDTHGDQLMFYGAPGVFTGFRHGKRIQVSGFSENELNTGGDDEWYILESIATDDSHIIVSAPFFLTGGRSNAAPGDNVIINEHPAPDAYVEVTAGFDFDVPVRFDIDQLPVSLDHYGISSVDSIPVVEIRKQ